MWNTCRITKPTFEIDLEMMELSIWNATWKVHFPGRILVWELPTNCQSILLDSIWELMRPET